MTKPVINVGDFVSVSFHGSQITLCSRARVEWKPCATGDSWIFFDMDTESLYQISEGCTIRKLQSTECGDT